MSTQAAKEHQNGINYDMKKPTLEVAIRELREKYSNTIYWQECLRDDVERLLSHLHISQADLAESLEKHGSSVSRFLCSDKGFTIKTYIETLLAMNVVPVVNYMNLDDFVKTLASCPAVFTGKLMNQTQAVEMFAPAASDVMATTAFAHFDRPGMAAWMYGNHSVESPTTTPFPREKKKEAEAEAEVRKEDLSLESEPETTLLMRNAA